mmetsp:Transcript_10678/g.14835  ORF Transcript_10678/g.14835 Transcript_10678/m.14835 type:complete len:579 (+) Transcript_10678:124-1860(+)|eukprot:CAMPEP_0184479644 /NCGR_PEP_ID=MMETSP0113_2-20130426/1285_1 /TAXON_ID=91329 /ORGANISM="Norrisiella sphaerica, Strain BC52" /LENGTH=578 /DNA_ID=CAMNT_0026857767 /DNA_START=126 /DNA_END=1862 /DNA_ORIENTATION=+
MAKEIPNGIKKNGMSKRAQRRARKKAQKKKLKHDEKKIIEKLRKLNEQKEASTNTAPDKIQFVSKDDSLSKFSEAAPQYSEFKEIFSKFSTPADLMKKEPKKSTKENGKTEKTEEEKDEETAAMEEENMKKLSAKQRRKLGRLSIAELKQLVPRPDVVGLHDCNSHDPKLLVHLKGYRNTVPVPGHWCQKRKYLQGKRGLERSAFELPQFIADTGIGEVRSLGSATEDGKSLKGKQKERMQPKMGKIDIDYQVLHDAFFRHQTKPNCTGHGDLYYEGKEYEVRFSSVTPTDYSEELMKGLGMGSRSDPPPWLFNMQRFGPPPSYPNLKFPGVNAPIPPGASYGFGEGQWGKAPVDAYNRPLYGDVYGTQTKDDDKYPVEESFKEQWGKVEDEDEEEEEEEDEEEDEEDEAEVEDDSMMETSDSDMKSGIESVSSLSSGMETPETLQLRKKDGTGTETPDTVQPPKQLYQVLEEKKTGVGGTTLLTSGHTYVMPTNTETTQVERKAREAKKLKQGAVEVALTPEEMANMSAEALKEKYQQQVEKEKEIRSQSREDVSDVIAEETRKRKQKTKKKSKFKF